MFNKIIIDREINAKKRLSRLNSKTHGFCSDPIESQITQKKDTVVENLNLEKFTNNIPIEKRKNNKLKNSSTKRKKEKVEFNYLKQLSQRLKGKLNSEKLLKSSIEVEPLVSQNKKKEEKISEFKNRLNSRNKKNKRFKNICIQETFGKLSENQNLQNGTSEIEFKDQINYFKSKLKDKNEKINLLFKRIKELEQNSKNDLSYESPKKENFNEKLKTFISSQKKKIYSNKKDFESENKIISHKNNFSNQKSQNFSNQKLEKISNKKNYPKENSQKKAEFYERGNTSQNENYRIIRLTDQSLNLNNSQKDLKENQNLAYNYNKEFSQKNKNRSFSRNFSRADVYLSKLTKTPLIIKSSKIIENQNFENLKNNANFENLKNNQNFGNLKNNQNFGNLKNNQNSMRISINSNYKKGKNSIYLEWKNKQRNNDVKNKYGGLSRNYKQNGNSVFSRKTRSLEKSSKILNHVFNVKKDFDLNRENCGYLKNGGYLENGGYLKDEKYFKRGNDKENFMQKSSNGVYVRKYNQKGSNCFYNQNDFSEKKKSNSVSKYYGNQKITYKRDYCFQKENPYFNGEYS